MENYLPKNKLKLIYIDILRGFSGTIHNDFGEVCIKHFTSFDIGEVEIKQDYYLKRAIEEGLPTLKEREEYLIKEGFWSTEKDQKIAEYKDYLKTLHTTKSKLFREKEIAAVNGNIEEYAKKLEELEKERGQLIEFTAEQFSSKKMNEYYIFNSFYKDGSLKERLFSEDQFNDLTEEELYHLSEFYSEIVSGFNNKNLKRIALAPFFFNFFTLSDNCLEFFGKPVVQLTYYQAELYGHGRYFKNLLSSCQGVTPPEDLMEDPDKLIEWFNASQNAKDALNKTTNGGEKSAHSLMGVTQKDRERLGLETSQPNPNNNLVQMALQKGGELNMADIMSALGQ